MNILIAEDNIVSNKTLTLFFTQEGHQVSVAETGTQALKLLQEKPFDVLLTDWMMPEMDGVELVRQARNIANPCPVVIMFTALNSTYAKTHALKAGADDYLNKPYKPVEILKCIELHLLSRQAEKNPFNITQTIPKVVKKLLPPFFGVSLVAGSGGPTAYAEIFRSIPTNIKAAFFIVLHAPAFIIQAFTENLQKETPLPVVLAQDLLEITPGKIYVAPGDYHLCVENPPLQIKLVNSDPENFVRPAADPLFRSIAEVFGPNSLAVILTGLGRDGLNGANKVLQVGGNVIVQDPKTAFSSLLPQNIIKANLLIETAPLEQIATTIIKNVRC